MRNRDSDKLREKNCRTLNKDKGWSRIGNVLLKINSMLRPTLAKMFSRELVREVRALFLRISSLKRLLVAVPSPADELFAAFCQTITMDR